jgi:hypothetical protein
MSYGALCDRRFGHVSVTGGTGNACLIMWRMTEFYMSFGGETVNTHPWDLNVLIRVCSDLLNLRFFFGQLGVTQHALANRGNTGGGAGISANVTVETGKTKLHVSVVRKRDWLLR